MPRIIAWIDRNKMGIVLLPWLFTALSLVAAKISILYHSGFAEIALSLRDNAMFRLWEKISLLRSDCLFYFLIFPIVFWILTFRLPIRLRICVSIVFASIFEVVALSEVGIYKSTGAFSSARNIAALISWTIKSRDPRFIYLPVGTACEIAALLILGVATAIYSCLALRQDSKRLNEAAIAILLAGSAAAAVASIPRVPPMPWSESLLRYTVNSAFLESNTLFRRNNRSMDDLMQTYRSGERVVPPASTAYSAKAKNYNVMLFVMESLAAQAVDPATDSLADMPNLRRLRNHAFVMANHFTSYPLTNAATFSIFTSVYAKSATGSILTDGVQLPGLIRDVRGAGYDTGFFGFIWKYASQRDDRMLRGLGFQRLVEPDIDAGADRSGRTTYYGPAQYTAAHDHQVLQAACRQIHEWTGAQQKVVAAFFPELGHDPYRELEGHHSHLDMQRGHALAVYQDAWLGELIDELERDHALDNTIIVFTSDHGMRTEPSPDVVPTYYQSRASFGRLEDATVRVPMLIYAPGVLAQEQRIEIPTSHIDITPTLLDLLGVSAGRDPLQGLPVYSPQVADRRLFLSMDMLGASGFYDRGQYFSSGATGVVYKSPVLRFTNRDVLAYDSPEAAQVRALLIQHDAEQDDILDRMLEHSRQ
jgi:arylsulfatase A-like enzyme